MRSLVIGRFQPLHLGHVRMLEHAASNSSYLVIGVGSCNSEPTQENPFSAEEREMMLKESLSVNVPYEIRRIPDFGDDAQWVGWIRENVGFDALMTNSPRERRIFQDAGLKVLELPFFGREVYSATEVRRRILEDGDWLNLLPEGTARVLGKVDGIYRIKGLAGGRRAGGPQAP
jgi:nicotinamide-nucleotide adenylyltransferase